MLLDRNQHTDVSMRIVYIYIYKNIHYCCIFLHHIAENLFDNIYTYPRCTNY